MLDLLHNHALDVVLAVVYLIAAVYVLVRRKHGASHRRHVCWLAWFLLVVLGGSCISLLLHPDRIGLLDACREILLCVFVFRARGDMARLLRSE